MVATIRAARDDLRVAGAYPLCTERSVRLRECKFTGRSVRPEASRACRPARPEAEGRAGVRQPAVERVEVNGRDHLGGEGGRTGIELVGCFLTTTPMPPSTTPTSSGSPPTYPAGRGLPVQRRRQPPLGPSVSPYSSL